MVLGARGVRPNPLDPPLPRQSILVIISSYLASRSYYTKPFLNVSRTIGVLFVKKEPWQTNDTVSPE